MVFCYRDVMYRFARNLLNNDTEAQDCVQVVMIKLWQQKDRLGSIGGLKAYAMGAIKNECLNKLKQQEVNGRHQLQAAATQPTHYSNYTGNISQLIRNYIQTLPEKQKMVMLLKDLEGFETDEIAQLLDMEEGTVRTNLARARQKVRTYLQKIEVYEQQQVR